MQCGEKVGSVERDIIFLFIAKGGRRMQRAFSPRAKGELRAIQIKTRVNSLMIHRCGTKEREGERAMCKEAYVSLVHTREVKRGCAVGRRATNVLTL